ncbi:DegV family protein [Vagococcus salmoninarum]|uniref:DegV family protein n=1 Tax=Vagococcus salmoninarum TaxID=2739 RepID=UPI0014774526|nr:DegV family protein [Vagococcus salmoninarum]
MPENPKIELNHLIQAFKLGAERVIANKNELNEINVFPVADGDTGSNLASLMTGILTTTYQKTETVTSFLEEIAEAAFEGARGNSGIILSQYFSGLARYTKSNQFSDFTQTLQFSVDYAYEAIETPVEGTMLTVIKVWAEAVRSNYAETGEVKATLELAFKAAEVALKNTPNQLAILKKRKVVDSGAKGFVYFLEGFTESFLGEVSVVTDNQQTGAINKLSKLNVDREITKAPKFRYCTEILLEDVYLNSQELKIMLRELGDSLVVGQTQRQTRVHIHTNEPAKVIASLNAVGTIKQQKADDMLLQYLVKSEPNSTIAIVTDSVADIPEKVLLNQQIHVLPLTIIVDGVAYIDKVTLDSQGLFQMASQVNQRSTTSLPSLATIQNLFSFLESHYEKVIFITVAKELSGTYNAVEKLANNYRSQSFEVAVIDSKQNSAAQGLVVLEAAKMIEEQRPFNDIVEQLNNTIQGTKIFVSIESLDAMISSGRIPTKVGKVIKRISLNPIVSLSKTGGGAIAGVAFSRQGSEKKILKKVCRLAKEHQLVSYSIVHAGNSLKAQEWAKIYTEKIGVAPAYVMNISTVVALGAGQGSVAIALTYQERG